MTSYSRKLRRRSRKQRERAVAYRIQRAERARSERADREFKLATAGSDEPHEVASRSSSTASQSATLREGQFTKGIDGRLQ